MLYAKLTDRQMSLFTRLIRDEHETFNHYTEQIGSFYEKSPEEFQSISEIYPLMNLVNIKQCKIQDLQQAVSATVFEKYHSMIDSLSDYQYDVINSIVNYNSLFSRDLILESLIHNYTSENPKIIQPKSFADMKGLQISKKIATTKQMKKQRGRLLQIGRLNESFFVTRLCKWENYKWTVITIGKKPNSGPSVWIAYLSITDTPYEL